MARQNNYNPDVLSCLANLSSDEVFTPPSVVNDMLDSLPENIWESEKTTFLDPASKSGVFLREIAKRLIRGLEHQIPNLEKRINHIAKKQLYGISNTELTALISRRSVYCSKNASGKYSVTDIFDSETGNIFYTQIQHTWIKGKCKYCGASEKNYNRSEDLESYAYEFIHMGLPEKILNMKFDVIIGNPPYQLSDGGYGKSASPIYNLFVQTAKQLNPKYLTMVIPSRWFGGGKGLSEFRKEMLNDRRIRKITDFENARDCFPNIDIAGGVLYFLWDRDNEGSCEITNVSGKKQTTYKRELNEFPTFIRNSEAISIIRKVQKVENIFMNSRVSSRKPFGLPTDERPTPRGDLILRWQKGDGKYDSKLVSVGREFINKWKVITGYVAYDHAGNPGKDGKRRVFSKIDILAPGTICTETYLVVSAFDTKKEAINLQRYMKTKFFRFLVSQNMYSHHITKETYSLVPVLLPRDTWNDEKLAKRYDLSDSEVDFIGSKIRLMDK